MSQPTSTYLNAIDPLMRLELLCINADLPESTLDEVRQLISEAKREREQWKDAYVDSAMTIKQQERRITELNQQNLAPLYGPMHRALEDYVIDGDKLSFISEKLHLFTQQNTPTHKGYYKRLATILTTWKQLGWMRSETYYGSDEDFVLVVQDLMDTDIPIRRDSMRKALRRQKEIRAVEQRYLNEQMIDEYNEFCRAV